MSTMAEVLILHQYMNASRERYCECGVFLGDWAGPAEVATHQADMLAAAGFGKLAEAWNEGCAATTRAVRSGADYPVNPYKVVP